MNPRFASLLTAALVVAFIGAGLGISASINGADADGPITTDAVEEPQTELFEPLMDVLLEGNYVIAPANLDPVFTYTFEVTQDYDTLEAVGAYVEGQTVPFYAVQLDFTVTGPSGDVVMEYSSQDVMAVVTGLGSGSATSMPLGYAFQPEPGTYTVSISGAGSSTLDLRITGYKGQAPDFEFRLLDSEETEMLSDHRGHVVLVDLMATWCGPCNDAMPDLVSLKEDYGDDVEILSIDVDDAETDAELSAFKEKHGATWEFGFDLGDASANYGTGWIPTFAIVDQHGGLLYRQIGAMDPAKCREIIDYALENL